MFRLFPLAVGIITAIAFGDLDTAKELRKHQVSLLPAIADCNRCRGRVLANEEICPVCSNPLWGYNWLTAAD